MDDTTLQQLETALAATPGNLALRLVLVRALGERRAWVEAARIAEEVEPAGLADADRALVARVLLESGRAERALLITEGGAGEALVARARALVALGREREAADAYERAVRDNPALEDVELAARVSARVVELPGQRPRLRVISNDDTDALELRRLLEPAAERVTFAEVGGLEQVKEQIRRRIILPFQKPALFARFKKRVGGGILLYGPPGCGKTLLARATAGECSASFFDVAIDDVLDMYIGESERKLHALFEEARRQAPAVIFFDEIEALGGKRQYTREATASKLVSQFLSEMDGFAQNNTGVLVIGSTNVPWGLDPAFRRPGRFDRVVFVPPPDLAAREQILRILLRERPVADGVELGTLAKATSTFSGADLANLVETASDEAIQASLISGHELPITQEQLREALAEVKPTTLEWLTTARNYARYANEAGQYDDVLEFLKQHGRE